MSQVREIVCLICPNSCVMKVYLDGERILKIEGNMCPRGEEYAKQEVTEPKRIVISVVKVNGGEIPTVSVKTKKPVPKRCISKIMKILSRIKVDAPVSMGQIIVEDVCGTDIIATRDVKRRSTLKLNRKDYL